MTYYTILYYTIIYYIILYYTIIYYTILLHFIFGKEAHRPAVRDALRSRDAGRRLARQRRRGSPAA